MKFQIMGIAIALVTIVLGTYLVFPLCDRIDFDIIKEIRCHRTEKIGIISLCLS